MKSVKITLSIVVLLAFLGLNETYGQWAPDGINIHNTNAGNVGIGNFPAATLLHVGKNMVEPTIRVHNLGGAGGATFQMMDMVSGADWKFKATITGGFKIRDNAWGFDVIQVESNSAANSLYIDAAGDVAMGFNTPNGNGLNVINYTYGKAAVQGLDQSGTSLYASGMLGVLDGPGIGVPVYAYNIGVLGIKLALGANGAAVCGWNLDNNSTNYGGLFISDGTSTGTTNFGAYASAMHATDNFAGKFIGRVEVDGHPSPTEAADYISTVFKATVTHAVSTDTRAVDGVSTPADGYGIGVYGTGGWMGVRGECVAGAYGSTAYGVYGSASGTAGTRIGVYGTASGGTTNWAGYFAGDAYVSSDLRIGTTTQATGYSLSVNGKVACEEVLVEDLVNWPDYVFAEDYNLMSLEELEQNIQKNNHLPGLPSAAEIEEDGLMLGDMQKRMVEKLEELTLYTIEQGKLISELKQRMEQLEKENANLKDMISK
jgi:hypothetical protein